MSPNHYGRARMIRGAWRGIHHACALACPRYIGPVKGQEGTWVGVEWDDASRGKHDGSTGGVKYFSCESGDNAGSFIRAEKVGQEGAAGEEYRRKGRRAGPIIL